MKSRFLLLFVWIAAGLARGPLLCGAEGQVTPPGLFLNYQLPAPQPHFITRTAGASGSTSLVRAPNLLLQFATPPVMEGVRFKKIAYSYAGGTGTASFTLDPFGTYDYETFRQGWEISVSGDLTEVAMLGMTIDYWFGPPWSWAPSKYDSATVLTPTFMKVPYSDGVRDETWTLSDPVPATSVTTSGTSPWSEWVEGNPSAFYYSYTSDGDPISGWSRSDAEYRVVVSPAMTGQTVKWAEVLTPDDNPETPEDESLSPEIIERSWVVDGQQSPVFHLVASRAGTATISFTLTAADVVSRDRFLAGSFEAPEGLSGYELEFVNISSNENLGSYGQLAGGGATRIYNGVEDILSDADFTNVEQLDTQKVWFVRDPANTKRIHYYTCFNAVGVVEIRVKRNGEQVRVLAHTLTDAPDFGDWINYVDQWVKGTGFRFPDDVSPAALKTPTARAASPPPPAPTELNNLTRACLIPIFNVVAQVEGMSLIAIGAFDGIKAGHNDDVDTLAAIGIGILATNDWAVSKVKAELNEWRNPRVRAMKLKEVTDRLCYEWVLIPAAGVALDFSTWEGCRKRAKATWQAIQTNHAKAFALTLTGGFKLGNGLIDWADDFAARMLQGSRDGAASIGEHAAWLSNPWTVQMRETLQGDLVGEGRQMAYTFGYVCGYLGEQIVMGAVTAGATKYGQVLAKGGVKLVGLLASRTAFQTASRAHLLKKVLADTAVAGSLQVAIELGLATAGRAPVDAVLKTQIAEVIEHAFEREGFDRSAFNLEKLIGNILASPRQRLLFETTPDGLRLFQKTARVVQLTDDAFTGRAGRNWQKVFENLLPLQQNDVERAEDFFRLFRLDTPEGRLWLKETLEALDNETAGRILRGLKVSERVKDVYPTLYHYSDAKTLMDYADWMPDGTLRLRANAAGRYLTPINFNTQADAQNFLQLPKAKGNNQGTLEKALTKGRFKCIVRTSDIADDITVPQAFRHGDGSDQYLGWLEAVLRDNPERGLGGVPQLTNKNPVTVDVIDTMTGRTIHSEAELLQALADI